MSPSSNPPSVLVTGATGFLGGALALWLHERGWKVIATGRRGQLARPLINRGIRFIACDLSANDLSLQALMDQLGPNGSIVHCAALSSPWGRRKDFISANVVATQRLISAALINQVRHFVHISTPAVMFEYAIQRQLNEALPWTSPPANHYVETKRQGEMLIRKAMGEGLPATILRPKALFGAGDTTLLPRVIKVASRGRFPLFGDDVELDLTWIGDACQAIELALASPPLGRCYFVTSGLPLSRDLVLKTLFDACGLAVKFKRIPRGLALTLGSTIEWLSRVLTLGLWEPPLTRYSVGTLAYGQTLDISAAKADLGYAPQTDILAELRACGADYRLKL